MADPFGDNVEFSQIPPSQDLLFQHAAEDSLDTGSGAAVDSDPATPISRVSPPDSSEQPSQDHYETPPEEAQLASSSEDVCLDRTLDLAADAKLGFSETEVAQKPAADSGGRGEKVMVEVSESELEEFRNWKRKMAFRENILKSSNLDSPGSSLKKKANNLVVSGMVKNDLGSNACSTQLVSSASVGKAVVSDTDIAKTMDCTQVLDFRDCGGKGLMEELGMAKASESIDCNEVEVAVSYDGIAKNVLDSNDHTEVVMLDSGDNDVLVLEDEGTGKNGLALDTEEIMVDANDEGLVLGSGIVNDGAQKGVDDNDPNVGKSEEIGGPYKGIDDTDKFKYVGLSDSDSKVGRKLPMSMQMPKQADRNQVMDLLEFVSKRIPKTELDPEYENLSILEIAKARGVTFPRPSWWDDERKFP